MRIRIRILVAAATLSLLQACGGGDDDATPAPAAAPYKTLSGAAPLVIGHRGASGELLDPRWQLVHATHTVPAEIDAVARAGSAAVICPSTEANLGDGLADLPGWLDAGVGLAIGSDSHVTRCWPEELRWMEYGQRLLHRKRNVAAAPDRGQPATAARLWQLALDAGGRAAGQAAWGLRVGARADLLVIDTADAALVGVPGDHRLDALVFSSPGRPWQEVMVAGRGYW